MFKNEAETVLRMLESCYKYIDYWVIQDNGSTDGTQDLVQNFMNPPRRKAGFLKARNRMKFLGAVVSA